MSLTKAVLFLRQPLLIRHISASTVAGTLNIRSGHGGKDLGGLSCRRSYGSGGWRYEGSWETAKNWSQLAVLGTVLGGSLGLGLYLKRETAQCAEKDIQTPKYGAHKDNLPTYRIAEIASHNSWDKRIWVTYKNGVYDVTDFVAGHPGGTKILLAAGKAVEPFFRTYAIHWTEEVMDILDGYRIGNVHPDDMKLVTMKKADDPFVNDPDRHPVLVVNSEKPFNAEPPPELLTDNFNTPNEIFFVRNHLPVPKIDEKRFKVEISGIGVRRPLYFTVEELKKKFQVHTISAALQCAGNRRSEMAQVKHVRGLSWGTAAISNAEWTGVKLVDVLKYVGVKEEDVAHVLFQGLDKDIENVYYETSVPAETVFDPRRDVILAFEMNGEPIPLDHGFPLRVIIPGVAGARQVKWLSKIIMSPEESHGHFQRNDYKSFHPCIDWNNVDFSQSVAIQEYPIQSAICEPAPGSVLPHAEEVTIKGYAWSGGGRGIIRVDVSIDGGKTWQSSQLQHAKQKVHQQWAWTLWEATVPIPKDHKGELDIVCKAVDTSHNCQPETAEGIWNLRGLINNAWHRIQVKVPEE
jgi:sulfite oxidase